MKVQSFARTAVMLALSSSFFLACKEKKQLSEIHDNTQQINQNTAKTSDNVEKTLANTDKTATTIDTVKASTDQIAITANETKAQISSVAKNTQQTADLISETFDTRRQATSLELRTKIFEVIIQNKTPIDKKISLAEKYFLAFEFQLWPGAISTSEIKTDALALEAVSELFSELKTVAQWDADEVDPFARPNAIYASDYEVNNQKAVFNSLAAALHKSASKPESQNDQAKAETKTETKAEKASMFSLLQTGLLAGVQIRAKSKRIEDFSTSINEVLKNESLAIRLLQARYNILGAMFLGRVSKVGASNWEDFKLMTLGLKWSFDLNSINISQTRAFQDYMLEAEKTKKLLKQLGIKVELNSSLAKILSNMEISEMPNNPKNDDNLVLEKQRLVLSIKQYLGSN